MKRFLCSFIIAALLLLCGCKSDEAHFAVPQKGRFSVVDELSGTAFSAVLDGSIAEFTFTAPPTVAGLCAKTVDGVSYKLSYGGIETEFTGASVSAASDFAAALELLYGSGEQRDGVLCAEADGIYARAVIKGKSIEELTFYGGTQKRIYKIKTEA